MSDLFRQHRPPIPAHIRRRVLVEAGHRCAIPTCRYIEVEIHHIVPWAKGQTHRYDNLIALCANCHRRADRGEIDRKSLRLYKVNLRFAHDKFSQVEIDVLFQLLSMPVNMGIQWPPSMLILLKRLLDANYIVVHRSEGGVSSFGMRLTPDLVILSDAGRAFLAEMASTEL